jgi:subtilisin family serine protease
MIRNRFLMHTYWLLAILGIILALEMNSKAAETRTIVAIIDTGLDLDDPRFKNVLCSEGHRDLTGVGMSDTMGHGTFVAGLIQRYAESEGKYCLLIVKYYLQYASGVQDTERMTKAVEYALKKGAKFINISSGGDAFQITEYDLMKDHPSTTFVVAAGNNHKDVESPKHEYYPAAYRLNNVIVVGSTNGESGEIADFSNYGSRVDVWENGVSLFSTEINWVCEHNRTGYLIDEHKKKLKLSGCCGYQSGTSFSTAVHTGKLIKSYVHEATKMGCQDHSCLVHKKYN